MSLRVQAQKAWREVLEQRRVEMAAEARRVAAAFEERFGVFVAPCDFDLANRRFTVDELTFTYYSGNRGVTFTLLQFCPRCGQQLRFDEVLSLAEVGRMLSFPPDDHDCKEDSA